MKTVLVTGASGFLGGYIVDNLVKAGYLVIASGRNESKLKRLVQKNVSIHAGDLETLREFDKKVDFVVHAAALCTVWGKWEDFYKSNVQGTEAVLAYCRRHAVKKMLFVSSSSVYAGVHVNKALTEDDANLKSELNYYIQTKIIGECIVQGAHSEALNTIVIRPHGIIGVGDTSIAPRLLRTNQKIGIPLINNGDNTTDMVCVENVAHAIRLALESDRTGGGVYHITNGEPQRFRELINYLFKQLAITVRYSHTPPALLRVLARGIESIYKIFGIHREPPFTRYTLSTIADSHTYDLSRAQSDFGYAPIVSIKEGIDRYAEHYRSENS